MIHVSVTKTYKDVPFSLSTIKRIVEFVCRREKAGSAEFSFVIVNNRTIRTINKKFLNHDYVTDVIAFPLDSDPVKAEIYINTQQAKKQAGENDVTVRNELMRLVVHGTLHALGYKDTNPSLKKRMTAIQERYVSEMSLRK